MVPSLNLLPSKKTKKEESFTDTAIVIQIGHISRNIYILANDKLVNCMAASELCKDLLGRSSVTSRKFLQLRKVVCQ